MSSMIRPRDRRLRSRSLMILGGVTVAAAAVVVPASAAHAATPVFTSSQHRLYDSRLTTGAVSGLLPVQVTDDVPSGTTVELTVTAVNETGRGDIIVYPDNDVTVPTTSNVNYYAGITTSSTVVVTVPADGVIDLDVAGSPTNVVVDEQGFFTAATLTGAASPIRLGDSRLSGGGFAKTGAQTGTVSLTIPAADVPSGSGVLGLNVTAVPAVTGTGDIDVYSGTTAPATSTVNYNTNVATNLVFVKAVAATGGGYTVNFKVVGASANLVVDLDAYAPSGSTFAVPTTTRLADSRLGVGLPKGPLSGTYTLQLTSAEATAGSVVALNVTATGVVAYGHELAYPTGITPVPSTSNLQFVVGASTAQVILVPVSSSGQVSLYVDGKTQLVVDYQGVVSPPST